MKEFDYSESDIRAHCTEKVYARGEDYMADGMVSHVAWRGDYLVAEVEGSDDEPYSLAVEFENGQPQTASCTCPYEYEGWCKHIVAALLLALEDPDCIEVEIPLLDLLKPLSKRQLQTLLEDLVQENPAIYGAIVRNLE